MSPARRVTGRGTGRRTNSARPGFGPHLNGSRGNPGGANMTGDEIVALSRAHTITEYVPQNAVNPIPVARASGVYLWTPEGRRFIDFNSQLMSVNIGHGDPRVIAAIHQQASELAYANPFTATEPRARLGAKLAEITPGDIDT